MILGARAFLAEHVHQAADDAAELAAHQALVTHRHLEEAGPGALELARLREIDVAAAPAAVNGPVVFEG